MSERGRFNPEQEMAYGQLRGFFGRAEKESPAAAKQLVNVVSGLVGEQQTSQKKLQEGMENIDVGLALIGDWLKETGADGFDVKLGLGGGTKKAIGRSKVNFPTASDLIRVKGRVDPELQKQIPPLLSSFSRQIKGALDMGLPPRQIVGGLLSESVGSKLSANGSANLRQTLNKPLGGHFEWIREALGVEDVAVESGFKPVSSPKAKSDVSPIPLPAAGAAMEAEPESSEGEDFGGYHLAPDAEGGIQTSEKLVGEIIGPDGKRFYGIVKKTADGLKVVGGDIDAGEGFIIAPEKKIVGRVTEDVGPVPVPEQNPVAGAARELAGRIQKEAMIGEVKAASPAFLKKDKITGEYELPEGYEMVELGSQEGRLIPLDKRTGTALIYIENVGFRFTREGGIVHVRPTGFSWPNKSESLYGKALIIPAAGIPISEAGYLQRICVASNNSSNLKMYGGDRDDFVSLDIPDIDESQQGMPLLGLFRIDISIRKGHIKIENFNWKDRISLDPDFIKISVPAASRGEKLAAEKRQEIQRRAAEKSAEQAESKTENWEGAVKKLIEDPFAQIAYEQTQSVMAAAAAYSLNAEISNGLVGEEQFIGLVKRIAALSQNMRPKKAQPQLLLQWPEHQRLFLEDEISKTTYEATGSIVAAAAAFSLREEIMAGTIAEEKFVPFVREVATLVQKTRRQIKH